MLNEELKSAREALVSDWEQALSEYKALADKHEFGEKSEYGDEPELCVKVLQLLLASFDGRVNRLSSASEELADFLEHAEYVDIECLANLAPLFLKVYKKGPKFLQAAPSSASFNNKSTERITQMRNYLIDMSKSPEAANAEPEIMRCLWDKIAAIDAYLHLVRLGEDNVVGRRTSGLEESFGINFAADPHDMEMEKIYKYLGKSRFHYYGSMEWAAFVVITLFIAGGTILGFMLYM